MQQVASELNKQEPRGFTRSDFVIVCGGSVSQYVFHLKEFIWSVSTDDGETEALRTLLQSCAQDSTLQLRWVPCESPQTSFI